MTPEQIAADRIARVVEKGTGYPQNLAEPIGRTAYIPGTAAQRNSHKMAIRFRAAIEAERARQGLAGAAAANAGGTDITLSGESGRADA